MRFLYNSLRQATTSRRSVALWSVVAVGLGMAACQPVTEESGNARDRPTVVVTSTILTDLAATVSGDAVTVRGIVPPGDDPHLYEPVPQDTLALEQADLILYNGYNLEPNLIRLIEGAGIQAETLAVGEVVEPLAFEDSGQTQPDPHVWGDVDNAIAIVAAIRDALIALSPQDADTFTQNADALIAELTQLDRWILDQIETIPPKQRTLVTTHDAFQYYANAYGLTVLGTLIGISTEEQPSAQTVSQLVQAIRTAGVPTIFAETTINPALITTMAQEANVVLAPQALYSDSLGALGSGAETYVTMMVSNTQTIVEGLAGTYTPF
ncbi:MAG: zinc ABC transporter substrate-binding protein [Leptolyngbyaceae cyanobacterium T60_A2020_046]|nr:zinc ABC transporter substrate-binding protein [Leptolyngbyaceae cyanobacterium T60_A2020_046]